MTITKIHVRDFIIWTPNECTVETLLEGRQLSLLFHVQLYFTPIFGICKCYSCVHVVEKARPQLCFMQCPQYSLVRFALIRNFFCEYGQFLIDRKAGSMLENQSRIIYMNMYTQTLGVNL